MYLVLTIKAVLIKLTPAYILRIYTLLNTEPKYPTNLNPLAVPGHGWAAKKRGKTGASGIPSRANGYEATVKAAIGSLSHSAEDLIVTIVYALTNNDSPTWMYYSVSFYGALSFFAETYLAYPEQLAGDDCCSADKKEAPSISLAIRLMIIAGAISLNALRVFNLVNSSGTNDFDRNDPWGGFISDFEENIAIGVVISVLSLISVYFNYKQSLHSLAHLSSSDSFSKTTKWALLISLPNLCAVINLLNNMPDNPTGYGAASLWTLSIFLFNSVRQGVEIATSNNMNIQLIPPAFIISLFSLMGELPVFGRMTQSDLELSVGFSLLTAFPDNLYHFAFHINKKTGLGKLLKKYSEQSSCSFSNIFSASSSKEGGTLTTSLISEP